jgi:hypothetical protein
MRRGGGGLPKSVIVYRGPSRFDGAPIVAIVTGLRRPSNNPKTGRMAQLWILRSDMSPLEAIDKRADYSVCADCRLRGTGSKDRSCYVSMKNAPLAVYRAFKRGMYPTVDPSIVAEYLRSADLSIRFGAYGEPTALPRWILDDLAEGTTYTGYTHQWNSSGIAAYRHLLMASVDSTSEAVQAASLGWRTFRTRTAESPLLPREIACPASDEMGHRTTCAECALCDGARAGDRRKQIAIVVHGSGKTHYMQLIRKGL